MKTAMDDVKFPVFHESSPLYSRPVLHLQGLSSGPL